MSEIIYEIPKSVYPISVLFSFEKDQKKGQRCPYRSMERSSQSYGNHRKGNSVRW